MVTRVGGRKVAVESTDGRVHRGARNHEAIVDAVYHLVRETHLPPSVEEVARRAGVGTRTVFRQFTDLDALYRSMSERVIGELLSSVGPAAPSGNLEQDLTALVNRRARVFEHLTPFRRAARLVRHASPLLQERDAMTTSFFRGALEAVVCPHLVGVSDAEDTLEALDVLLSFEVWDRLRDQQKTSVKRAERILVSAAMKLATPATRPRARAKATRSAT